MSNETQCPGCTGPCGMCSDAEILHTFLNAVREMREIQRSYFSAKKQNNPRAYAILNEARDAERIVDNMIRLLSEPTQPTLFDK